MLSRRLWIGIAALLLPDHPHNPADIRLRYSLSSYGILKYVYDPHAHVPLPYETSSTSNALDTLLVTGTGVCVTSAAGVAHERDDMVMRCAIKLSVRRGCMHTVQPLGNNDMKESDQRI